MVCLERTSMHACKIIVYQLTSCTENCVVVTCSFCWLHVASWIGHNVIDHACAVIVLAKCSLNSCRLWMCSLCQLIEWSWCSVLVQCRIIPRILYVLMYTSMTLTTAILLWYLLQAGSLRRFPQRLDRYIFFALVGDFPSTDRHCLHRILSSECTFNALIELLIVTRNSHKPAAWRCYSSTPPPHVVPCQCSAQWGGA